MATHVEIQKTDFLHIRELCENLRERERRAIERHGETAEHLITAEVAKSLQCWTGLVDGCVICIWGIQTVGFLSEDAYVWLACTETLHEYPKTFLRHSREALAVFRPMFKRVYGCVFDDFEESSRWLDWLGFTVTLPDERGLRLFELRT